MSNPATTYSPVWPGPRLLAPVTFDVLLLGTPNVNSATQWASTRTSYYNLWMGNSPDAPAPFSTKESPSVGAHLLWTLPFSLRQGNQSDDGNLDFPMVPNRWLITRFQYDDSGSAPKVTSKVLQSDLLSDLGDSPSQYNQYPFPEDINYPVRRIGADPVDLENWEGPGGPSAPFLKAVGPGEVSWAVAYDNVNNVFTFHDPLQDGPATYTYMIQGWFASPEDDPISGLPTDDPTNWQTALTSLLNWDLGGSVQNVEAGEATWIAWQKAHGLVGTWDPNALDLPPQAKQAIVNWHNWQSEHGVTGNRPSLPTQMLCHGMTATIKWEGKNIAYPTGAPGGGSAYPDLAVGNNAVEAISAYMAKLVVDEYGGTEDTRDTIERAIEAFQKDLIFDLEANLVETEAKLQQSQFGSAPGGSEWIVVRPEEDATSPSGSDGKQSIPLNKDQTEALIKLNATQNQYDTINAQLFSQRTELFALYFKSTNLGRHAPAEIAKKVTDSMTAMRIAVDANIKSLATLQPDIDGQSQALVMLLGTHYELKKIDLTSYYSPNDPVIMVCGAEADTKLSQPGAYGEDNTLFTRFTGQTITGIQVSDTVSGKLETEIIDGKELLAKVTVPQGKAIPKEAIDLWVEAMFLDTTCAGLIASIYFEKLNISPSQEQLAQVTKTIQTQQTVIWNDQSKLGFNRQALGQASGFQGVVPSKVAVEFRESQPWTPIYLDWKILWNPTSDNPKESLENWELDNIDYNWTGSKVTPPESPLIYQGRTILNPKTAQDIKSKIGSFQQDPNYDSLPLFVQQNLQRVAAMIGKMDMLTQSFSGLSQQLATKIISISQAPTDDQLNNELGDSPTDFKPVAGNINANASGPFFPIRSGHLEVIDLWVVDSYGQILRGKNKDLGPNSPIPNIVRAETVRTPNNNGQKNEAYIQLPPRLNQNANLNFRLLQADSSQDSPIPTNSSDETSPICGWVMPNHLDNSLMVFSAEGENLGSVIKVERDLNQGGANFAIRWDAAPGTDAPLGSPPNLPNDYLQSFIVELLNLGLRSSKPYDDLMVAVDESLWPISQLPSQNGNIAILLGKPLAVVRADIAMQLYGHPNYNESWTDTGKYYLNNGQYDPTNPPYLDTILNARIGDIGFNTNGVLGYFSDDQYDKFYAVYGTSGSTAKLKNAFAQTPQSVEQSLQDLSIGNTQAAETNSYVAYNHLIPLKPTGERKNLTLLVDPNGEIPVISGSLPSFNVALSPGPVSLALQAMKATFRVGPILTDPKKIKMPLPAEIKGKWSWIAREDVTTWSAETKIQQESPTAKLETEPKKLIEGWLTLSGTED